MASHGKLTGGKVGKPNLVITDDMITKAGQLAARGLTQEQIAACLGIGEKTLYEKKHQYPLFAQAIKDGSAKGISIVTNKLFENVLSGNLGAQIFYLKCRANWREVNVQEITIIPHEDWIEKLK